MNTEESEIPVTKRRHTKTNKNLQEEGKTHRQQEIRKTRKEEKEKVVSKKRVINTLDILQQLPMINEIIEKKEHETEEETEDEETLSKEEVELPREKTPQEKFHDFDEFITFINTQVCPDKKFVLPTGQSSRDEFCYHKDNFTLDYFTIGAPDGYSLLDVPVALYEGKEYPFYIAIKHIFSLIDRYNLSERKQLYMIILNRFIYYYQIYLLFKESKLGGFEKTTGIIIYTHGGYNELDESVILPVEEPLKNVFICAKAAMGCISTDDGRMVISDASYHNSTLRLMIDNIKKKGFVNFDQSVFRYKEPIHPSDTLRIEMTKPEQYSTIGNCYDLTCSQFGKEMQHYIIPMSKFYLNKEYQGNLKDHKCFVIDLDLFNSFKGTDPITRLNRSNILNQQYFTLTGKLKKIGNLVSFTLKDIIDYCKDVKRNENVFIYDKSCSDLITHPTESEIITKVTHLVREHGLGRSKRYKKNKSNKKRNKKNKSHKKKKTIKRRK